MTPTAPHRSPFARAHDAAHLAGISFFLVLALAGLARGAEGSGTAALLFAGLLAATAWLAGRVHGEGEAPAPLLHLHVLWPLLVLPAVFTGLRWLVPAALGDGPRHVTDFDVHLGRIDREWFGVDVPRWSERILTPALADVSMAFYAAYFLMPPALLAVLLLRGDRFRVYRALFTVAAGLYACYALYLLVPAAGPRHAYVGLSEPLPRGWITGWTHDLIRDLEPQPFDAFPSAHVVLGLTCAAIAWPLRGWFRWTMAILGVGTALSTVVLRYHWLVDDVAGLGVLALALGATALLDRRAARKAAAGGEGDRVGELLSG